MSVTAGASSVWIQISAPSVRIYSLRYSDTTPAYDWNSGTSFACPQVAGAFALALSVYGPDSERVTHDQILNCAWDMANNLDSSNPSYQGKLGAGLLDVGGMIRCVSELGGACVSSAPNVVRNERA